MRFKTDRFFSGLIGMCWMAVVLSVSAQDRIYRCGNEYTNAPVNPRECELMQGQTITVIQGTHPSGASKSSGLSAAHGRTKIAPSANASAPALGAPVGPSGSASSGATSVDPVDAKFRDVQKRAVLVAELKQVRERHAQLIQEYNEGEPEKIGAEARNHQKYLDRLAGLKSGIARAERDMDSLQRELARLPSTQVAQP